MSTQDSLISVLNVCDNFRPHISPDHLVPFLLTPKSSPPLGLLRPPVVAALRADNAWRSAHGHPLAWNIPDDDTTTAHAAPKPPPYVAFAPSLANASPAARTRALAETLERWRADANRRNGDGAFTADVIGGSRWRAEWYDVYSEPGGALRTDGRDPLTLLEVHPESGYGGYAFSMERAACALFGVITYGVHMTVYERKGDGGADADGGVGGEGPVRVWVPRRAATKPTCVSFFPLLPLSSLRCCIISRAPGCDIAFFFACGCKATPVCLTTRSRAASQVGRVHSIRSSKRLRRRRAWTLSFCGSERAQWAP